MTSLMGGTEAVLRAAEALPLELVGSGRRGIQNLGLIGQPFPDVLVYVTTEAYLRRAAAAQEVSGVIVSPDLAPQARDLRADWHVLAGVDPKESFWRLHELLAEAGAYDRQQSETQGVHSSAQIHATAVVDPRAEIGPGCKIEEFAVIRAGVRLAAGVHVGPHSVIGSEGFQITQRDGRQYHIRHVGGVEVGEDVHIHSHVCVDRAIWGQTVVAEHSHLDNLVHVAHNCFVGRNCRLAAGVILAGSVRIGDECSLGIGALVRDGLTIGAGCAIPMGAVIVKSVAEKEVLMPVPALDPHSVMRLLGLARGGGVKPST